MPPKPQYIHDLIAEVKLLTDRVANLRRDANDLAKATESLKQTDADLRLELLKEITAKHDGLKEMIAEVRREVAAANQKLENLTKQVDAWDRRWWGLVVLLVGAVLSLASGLIVALVRR